MPWSLTVPKEADLIMIHPDFLNRVGPESTKSNSSLGYMLYMSHDTFTPAFKQSIYKQASQCTKCFTFNKNYEIKHKINDLAIFSFVLYCRTVIFSLGTEGLTILQCLFNCLFSKSYFLLEINIPLMCSTSSLYNM